MSSFARDKQKWGGSLAALLPALIPSALLAMLLAALYAMPLPWQLTWLWVPSLGVDLTLYVDGLSAQFLLLITGIGAAVFVYTVGYLAGNPKRNRVIGLLLLFMAAMIGAVVSDHLLVLFVFWELTGVLSFLLVGVDHELQTSRKSAQQVLLVTGSGGLFLLAGIILLGQIGGSYSLQTLILQAPLFIDDARLNTALMLIFIGAFSKSAQFPFHFWLPNAMAAPTPVSAYLHSATMVKLGIYLLARLDAAFSDLLFWEYTLIGIGTFTAVIAAIQTVCERDLKRILAWSTVATLGTLTMLVGLPGNGAALAVAALFFAHALYKAPLFFVAGNLDHGAGTRAIDKLTGMHRYMPWTAIIALLAALSMAGLPLTFGFIAKGAIVHAKEQVDALQVVSYATVFVNSVSVAVAAIAAIHIFWGRDRSPRQVQPHEVPVTMLLPPLILVVLGLLFGLVPTLVDPVLGVAVHAISPGFDVATVTASYDFMSVLKVMLGSILFGCVILFNWNRLGLLLDRIHPLHKIGPESWYWRSLELLPLIAARQTRLLQHGRLPRYLLTLVGAATLLLLALLFSARPQVNLPELETLTAPVFGASLLIAAGAVVAIFVRDHLVLLLVSGLVGYGCAVLFLFTGAPDLAFTQFAVETVFVVVVAAVLLRLRRMPLAVGTAPAEARLRPLALVVAIAFGATLTALVLIVSGLPYDSALADFFGEQSLTAAHGRNVVNLILVDFRALDTLGEISVLAFALLAALPLLKRLGGRQP
ncbi:MAG: hydrogen gas-evolving membrane-bound hydrogenase subunit E [Thiobacillus sp.]